MHGNTCIQERVFIIEEVVVIICELWLMKNTDKKKGSSFYKMGLKVLYSSSCSTHLTKIDVC